VIFGVIASVLGIGAVFWINALLLGAGGAVSHLDRRKDPPAAKQ